MGMSYLIDTHVLLWWLFDDPKLGVGYFYPTCANSGALGN